MGYCYYGNYAQYFEVGRVEALRSLGMSYRELEKNGIMLPVSIFNVRYILPAKYDDLLTVTTRIIAVEGARIVFEYVITNELNDKICEADTTLVFVSNKTMRPTAPSDEFLKILEPYLLHDE
ncbi:MAG: acyl-CoA thioesterase, partial [Bacteroidota bacterium]